MPVSSRGTQGSHGGMKRIEVHQYCNITPVSALETPDQVTQRLSGQSSSGESGSMGELGQELFPCPRVGWGRDRWGICTGDRSGAHVQGINKGDIVIRLDEEEDQVDF